MQVWNFPPTELTDHLDIFIQYFPINIFQLLDCLTDDSATPTIKLPYSFFLLIYLAINRGDKEWKITPYGRALL